MPSVQDILNAVQPNFTENEPTRVTELRNFALSLLKKDDPDTQSDDELDDDQLDDAQLDYELNDDELFKLIHIIIQGPDSKSKKFQGIYNLKDEIGYDLFYAAEILNEEELLDFKGFIYLLDCYDDGCIKTASYALSILQEENKLDRASLREVLSEPEDIEDNLDDFLNPSRRLSYRLSNKPNEVVTSDEIKYREIPEQYLALKKHGLDEGGLLDELEELSENIAVQRLILRQDEFDLLTGPRVEKIFNNIKHADSLLATIDLLISKGLFKKEMFDPLTKYSAFIARAHLAAVTLNELGLLNKITAKVITKKPECAALYSDACKFLYENNLWKSPLITIISKYPKISRSLADTFFDLKNARALDNKVIKQIASNPNNAENIAAAHIKEHKLKNKMHYKKKSTHTTFKQPATDIVDSLMEDLGLLAKNICK